MAGFYRIAGNSRRETHVETRTGAAPPFVHHSRAVARKRQWRAYGGAMASVWSNTGFPINSNINEGEVIFGGAGESATKRGA
ncbi:hypothetical protein DID96_02840 [Burkholderia sp. Bp8963]|nr:hypothetical protein DID96_02840 [Burkholderia sp. Bp8963]